jgi:gas vesicle protein
MAEITDSTVNRGSDEIRADIERTRAEMDNTFDALDQKLTPGQLLSEVWRYTKGGSSVGASKLWRLAREHPLPATMIGVGLGWLLVERSRSGDGADRSYRAYGYTGGYTGEGASGYGRYSDNYDVDYRSSYNEDLEDLEEGRLSSAVGAVKDATGHAVDTVKDAASTAREKVGDLTDTVKDRASNLSDEARQRAVQLKNKARYQTRKAKTGFWQMMEENPLAIGAATLTLGVIAGFSLPSTDKEDELLGERRDHLLERAKETGQEMLDKGKHVAEVAADKVKQEAEAQGLTPENLVDKVKAVGREAKNAVADEAKKQNLTPEALAGNQGNLNKDVPTTGGTVTGAAVNPPATPENTKPVVQPEPELARR